MTKIVRHPNGNGDDWEFPDTFSDKDIARAFADFESERNRRQAEIAQYHQLRDEMLRIQKTYSEEIAAVRHEAALARHEAQRAPQDADEADRLRHELEERLQENPEEIRRLLAGRDVNEPPSWLERRNEMLRRKLQGED